MPTLPTTFPYFILLLATFLSSPATFAQTSPSSSRPPAVTVLAKKTFLNVEFSDPAVCAFILKADPSLATAADLPETNESVSSASIRHPAIRIEGRRLRIVDSLTSQTTRTLKFDRATRSADGSIRILVNKDPDYAFTSEEIIRKQDPEGGWSLDEFGFFDLRLHPQVDYLLEEFVGDADYSFHIINHRGQVTFRPDHEDTTLWRLQNGKGLLVERRLYPHYGNDGNPLRASATIRLDAFNAQGELTQSLDLQTSQGRMIHTDLAAGALFHHSTNRLRRIDTDGSAIRESWILDAADFFADDPRTANASPQMNEEQFARSIAGYGPINGFNWRDIHVSPNSKFILACPVADWPAEGRLRNIRRRVVLDANGRTLMNRPASDLEIIVSPLPDFKIGDYREWRDEYFGGFLSDSLYCYFLFDIDYHPVHESGAPAIHIFDCSRVETIATFRSDLPPLKSHATLSALSPNILQFSQWLPANPGVQPKQNLEFLHIAVEK